MDETKKVDVATTSDEAVSAQSSDVAVAEAEQTETTETKEGTAQESVEECSQEVGSLEEIA